MTVNIPQTESQKHSLSFNIVYHVHSIPGSVFFTGKRLLFICFLSCSRSKNHDSYFQEGRKFFKWEEVNKPICQDVLLLNHPLKAVHFHTTWSRPCLGGVAGVSQLGCSFTTRCREFNSGKKKQHFKTQCWRDGPLPTRLSCSQLATLPAERRECPFSVAVALNLDPMSESPESGRIYCFWTSTSISTKLT